MEPQFSRLAPTEPCCKDDYILIQLHADTLSYIIYKKRSEEELIERVCRTELQPQSDSQHTYNSQIALAPA